MYKEETQPLGSLKGVAKETLIYNHRSDKI